MSIRKIPPGLKTEMLRLCNEGKDSSEIAQWLWTEHKIEVSSGSVRKALRARRSEMADVAKSVVREELRKELLPAIEAVTRVMRRAQRAERAAAAIGEIPLMLKAHDRQLKAANLLLHYAGLNQPDNVAPVAGKSFDTREALLQRIKVLAGVVDPKTEPQVH